MAVEEQQLGADTTVQVTIEVVPVDSPDSASIVVVTGTYSVKHLGVRYAQVLSSSGGAWTFLGEVAQVVTHSSKVRLP